VLSKPLRAAILAGALSLVALASSVASASAAVESQITAPAGPTYALDDATALSPPPAFKVEGTTTIGGPIALRCYYGTGNEHYSTVAKELTPSGGSFSAEVEPKSLPVGPCVLRAVPFGDEEAHPPGTASEESTDLFKGPRIVGSWFGVYAEKNANFDYELELSSLSGYFDIESMGNCGLDYSNLFAPETLDASNGLFYCNAALHESDPVTNTRSELQIDGANAYGPATADYLQEKFEEEAKVKVSLPGAPQVTVTKTFDPATGLVTLNEIDPIVKCSPSTVFPPTPSSCKAFVPTGVQLERRWQTSDANQVASMTDTWSSTDGGAHSLNALYDQKTVNGGKEGGAYEFPGTNVFSATAKGQTVALPPGLGKIYYKEDAATPGAGDGEHPQGAIVYDTPPSGPLSVYRGTKEEFDNGFEMPYQGTIPAGGSYVLHMTFVQAYKLSEVETLAAAAIASYPPSSPPTLTLTAPASGSTVSTPSVTVSGSVSDTRAITSLAVDGNAVSVGASGGAWSTTLGLTQGVNTIKVLATDQAGFSTEKSVTVTYTPIPPVAHASEVGSARGAGGEVSFTIACTGAAGTSCEVQSTLSTLEKTRHGKPVAVSARHHHRTRSTRVSVGSSTLTIPAGQRVTIAIQLNAAGKSLLSRFGRLPVHLTVTLVSAGRHSTIIAENLTVTPHRPRHRHHRHHRR
jgi:hypothetical protein